MEIVFSYLETLLLTLLFSLNLPLEAMLNHRIFTYTCIDHWIIAIDNVGSGFLHFMVRLHIFNDIVRILCSTVSGRVQIGNRSLRPE